MNINQLSRTQYTHLHRAVRCNISMWKNLTNGNIRHTIDAVIESEEFLEAAFPDVRLIRDETKKQRNLIRENKLTPRQERINLLKKKYSGPVYYIHSGRDCDGVEYSSSKEFDNEFEAEEYINSSYDWADGPMYFEQCSEQEYNEHVSYQRDTYAEAAGY